MKIFLILGVLFFGAIQDSKAQSPSDSVHVYKNFWGYKFYQDDERLNFNQLPHIMEDDQGAYYLINKARNNITIASIISGTGGFLIGWQLGNALFGGEPNWTLAAIGGGLIVISIPISSKSYKQSLEAVKMYNSGLSTSIRKPVMMVGMTENGVGIRLKF